MGVMIMVHRVPEGIDDPYTQMLYNDAGEYLPMGEPDALVAALNEALAATGAEGFVDERTGMLVPHGVDSVSFTTDGGQVRLIFVNRPTGEVFDALAAVGGPDWAVLDAGTGERYN
ncbi:hypothetical protein [Occultella gossypii]|uniref:Uncharacterized protein n=1 Tax=Occultella gossypii TaxID=2800820 RepID=A0ABS7SEX2_9MICO|nr:hypothetical protein [Occultella gossypii]MBZ2198612.1 hypothetical protein [Occultella gossypii]